MIKRMVSCALCVVCLVTLLGGVMAVSARASKVDFSLATTNGGIGDTVTVSVSLSADSYFTNTTMAIYYDPSVVQFSEERTGAISPASAMFMVLDYPSDGFVKGAYVSAHPIKKSGVLVEYDFVIVQETEMVFSIGFEECVGEDENGQMFDVDYNAGSCVLNRGKGKPATTAAPKPTTRVTEAPTPKTTRTTTTAASNANGGTTVTTNTPVVTEPTAPVTYPTDQNGITLAPHVVTEPNGNAATRDNGEVVTVATTAPTLPSTEDSAALPGDMTDPTDEQEPSAPTEKNNWLVPVIVVAVAVAIASGLAVVVMRKKKASASEEPSDPEV